MRAWRKPIVVVAALGIVAVAFVNSDGGVGTLVLAVVIGLALTALARAGLRAMGRAGFQLAEVHVLQPEARLGETVDVELILHPKRPRTVTGGRIRVLRNELARFTGGTRVRTYTQAEVATEAALHLPRELKEPFTHLARITIPADQPPTWRGDSNRLFTTVAVVVELEGWPDLQLTSPELLVRPEVAR